VVEFLYARRQLEETGDPRQMETMRRVAVQEMENALGAAHIYGDAPWLDLAERTDGVFSPCADMIEAKVVWIGEFLKMPGACCDDP